MIKVILKCVAISIIMGLIGFWSVDFVFNLGRKYERNQQAPPIVIELKSPAFIEKDII